jgi:hypothetical protein
MTAMARDRKLLRSGLALASRLGQSAFSQLERPRRKDSANSDGAFDDWDVFASGQLAALATGSMSILPPLLISERREVGRHEPGIARGDRRRAL